MNSPLKYAKQAGSVAFLAALALTAAGCGKSDSQPGTVVSGSSIVTNDLVSSLSSNICGYSSHAGDSCHFDGGQRVIYSDGSIQLTGIFDFLNTNTQDTDRNTITVLIPPYVNTSYQILSSHVDRGAGDGKLFLTYARSPELIQLVFDTNGNGAPDAGDEVIYTASTYHW